MTTRATPTAPTAPKIAPHAKVKENWYDLSLNEPGQRVRERAKFEEKELQAATPKLSTLVTHAITKTGEPALRVRTKGEERVGSDLDAHADKSGSKILHDVPVGKRGSDIPHVLIGPFGVYTISTKTHPGAKLWGQVNAVKINYGNKSNYVNNSRREAERASKLLTQRLGWTPTVLGVIVILTGSEVTELKIGRQPRDWVHVIGLSEMISWISGQPAVLTDAQVSEIYEVARRNTTWLG